VAVPVTAEEMRAAQMLTGATMAAWLACGVIPSIRPHATNLRAALLAACLLGCAGFVAYVLAG
jgi:hypothetical protein